MVDISLSVGHLSAWKLIDKVRSNSIFVNLPCEMANPPILTRKSSDPNTKASNLNGLSVDVPCSQTARRLRRLRALSTWVISPSFLSALGFIMEDTLSLNWKLKKKNSKIQFLINKPDKNLWSILIRCLWGWTNHQQRSTKLKVTIIVMKKIHPK